MIKLENISFDHCLKCTVCTIYCPVARASPLFPGPKQSGPDTERLRIKNPELVDESLKYCSNCKRCEIACPSQVKIADIIQSAKNKYLKSEYRLRDFFLSRTDLAGRLATLAGKPVNLFMHNKPVKTIISRTVGLPEDRPFPEYRQGQFRRWLARQAATQENFAEKTGLFSRVLCQLQRPRPGPGRGQGLEQPERGSGRHPGKMLRGTPDRQRVPGTGQKTRRLQYPVPGTGREKNITPE